MEVDLVVPEDRQVVQSYGPGRFRVSGVGYDGSVLVLPERTVPWPVSGFDDLNLDSLGPLFDVGGGVELVLIGCGSTAGFIPPAFIEALRAKNLALEAMATPAACRTYNVLAAEGRLVAAALIALPPEA